MRLDKEVRARVMGIIADKSAISKYEIVDVLRDITTLPTYTELLEQELSRTAQRLLSEYRDEHGVRSIFSVDSDRYINVDVSNDLPDLRNVEDQLARKNSGLKASLDKVTRRKEVVSGQLTLEEAME